MQIMTGIEVNTEANFPKLREYCPSAFGTWAIRSAIRDYSSRKFLREFLQKNYTCRGLDYLLLNIDEYWTAERVPSSGQPHTVCMSGNTISKWIRLMLKSNDFQ